MGFLEEIDNDLQDIIQGEYSEDLVLVYVDPVTLDELSISMKCIFDRTFIEIDAEGVAISSKLSRATISKTDFESGLSTTFSSLDITTDEPINWTATIRSLEFTLKSAESDGIGLYVLYLRKNDE